MSEFEAALKTQGRCISPVSLGWVGGATDVEHDGPVPSVLGAAAEFGLNSRETKARASALPCLRLLGHPPNLLGGRPRSSANAIRISDVATFSPRISERARPQVGPIGFPSALAALAALARLFSA